MNLANAGPPVLGFPNLLLFMPLPGRDVTDLLPDDPYTLIGWAYAQPIRSDRSMPRPPDGALDAGDTRPQQRRPVLACVPHHEWMLHAEGVHKPDGLFHTGLTEVVTLPVVGNVTQPVLGLRHTALWDLHIWREAPGTPATISLLNPRETPGLASPANAFFYPTLYD